jgi:hypothetical protein
VDDASKIETIKQHLRIEYGTGATALSALHQLRKQLAAEATEAVTLTGQTFEGGSHTGQLVFPRIMFLQCVIARLLELDPTIDPGPMSVTFISRNSRFLEL